MKFKCYTVCVEPYVLASIIHRQLSVFFQYVTRREIRMEVRDLHGDEAVYVRTVYVMFLCICVAVKDIHCSTYPIIMHACFWNVFLCVAMNIISSLSNFCNSLWQRSIVNYSPIVDFMRYHVPFMGEGITSWLISGINWVLLHESKINVLNLLLVSSRLKLVVKLNG